MGYWNNIANAIRGKSEQTFYELNSLGRYSGVFDSTVCSSNFVELFKTVSEVHFPIRYISERVASANFLLKKMSDDSTVWDNKQMNKFLTNPNPFMTFQELITAYSCYYLLTGKSFLYSFTPENLKKLPKWQSTDNFYVLPSNRIEAKFNNNINIYSCVDQSELIQYYSLCNILEQKFEPYNILHQKDTSIDLEAGSLGESRLLSQKKPISNLIAAYEARNVIYTKRGALGMIVGKKTDESGSVPLTKKEKDQILNSYYEKNGVSKNKLPVGISDVELGYINFGASIQDMQPFKETLNDAIQISGIYGIPADLIPREDRSTFSNQENAEVSVYQGTVIPLANKIIQSLTNFLGLEESGFYLKADFSEISVLQPDKKEEAEVDKRVTENCKIQFLSGVITLNDWRAKLGRESIENSLYNKTLLEMSESEILRIKIILSNGSKNNANSPGQEGA
jgi:phage portal protein BeeE